jgi:hypothetical protein
VQTLESFDAAVDEFFSRIEEQKLKQVGNAECTYPQYSSTHQYHCNQQGGDGVL